MRIWRKASALGGAAPPWTCRCYAWTLCSVPSPPRCGTIRRRPSRGRRWPAARINRSHRRPWPARRRGRFPCCLVGRRRRFFFAVYCIRRRLESSQAMAASPSPPSHRRARIVDCRRCVCGVTVTASYKSPVVLQSGHMHRASAGSILSPAFRAMRCVFKS